VTLKATSGRATTRRAYSKADKKLASSKEPMPLTISRRELLKTGSDRDFRRLVHGLFGFFSRHEKLRDGHARFIGLTGIDYTVLISIAHLGAAGNVSVRAVADHLHLSGPFITNAARRLLERGLIHKQADNADKRRVSLTISATGRELLGRLAPVQRQVNDVEFEGLSATDFTFLLDLIEKLIQSSERALALQSYLHPAAVRTIGHPRSPSKA
jgi:MarR family transcriptional regulator, organic hydroperoxide resistance regulator